jgi:methyltransferase family protein
VTLTAEPSLRDLALAMGTDKEGPHGYAAPYERHLARFRHQPVTLLEIGIGHYLDPARGGESLRMWKAYFPAGTIIGLDIEDKSQFAEERITILQGDQSDRALLRDIAMRHGPFDIVIDDGSHRCDHVITSFEALLPHVRDGGVYVVEDLQTSYWEKYRGSSRPNTPGTSMSLLQRLTDGLNYAEFDIPNYEPTYTDVSITSVAFYHNIAFVEKGPNLEGSNMLAPHPRASRRFGPPKRRSPIRSAARRVIPLPLRRAIVSGVRRVSGLARRRG